MSKASLVQERAKLLKLLETATHPTARDGERLNALNAFRKISDRNGGFDLIFSGAESQRDAKDLEAMRSALRAAIEELVIVRAERDSLRVKHEEYLSKKNEFDKTQFQARDEKVILSCINKDWQELHKIHEKAKRVGYVAESATTKRHLEALCATGKAAYREAGSYLDSSGSRRWTAPSWCLKGKSWFK